MDTAEAQSALAELVEETGRIVRELQLHDHELVKMTEAQLWECYLPEFQD